MLVALVGCTHGCLEQVYSTVLASQVDVKLVICCGDFQAVRGDADLDSLAVPPKYRHPGDFHLYYSGAKSAPVLTVFIGGNHEASNYMQELPYGGWVAPNIYYVGYAGVVHFGGIRIAGLSGIFKGHDYLKGHFETAPFTENTKRSVYHIRNLEVFRLRQLSGNMTICLSHDWPKGIVHHGNVQKLLQIKPFFRDEIERDQLGSPPCEDLLNHIRPSYWFAAHMHCLFPAIVAHRSTQTQTRFLALDKCLPNRKFLQILDIPSDEKDEVLELKYDLEWLTILRITNHLLSVRPIACHMPGESCGERYNFTPTSDEKKKTLEMLDGNLKIPLNFCMTLPPSDFSHRPQHNMPADALTPVLNPQTELLCDILQIDDPVSLVMLQRGQSLSLSQSSASVLGRNLEEEIIDDDDDDEECCEETENKHSKEVEDNITFVDSTASLSANLSTQSVGPHSRLSLPEPVQNCESDTMENKSKSSIVPECENFFEDVEGDSSTPKTTKKMFKRRNESLYSSNLDEE